MLLKNHEPDSSLAAQCYEQLSNLIINGTLAPGQKLKVEQLKTQLTAGQSPIREALSRLVSSGLVETENNKGFRVAQVSEADVRDVYNVYLQIELLALAQAIKRGDDAWEASIAAALHNLALVETGQKRSEPVTYEMWSARNYAFHVALISGCGSPLLLQIRADVYRRFDRYCRIAFNLANMELELNHEEHKQLADAVLARDLARATALMTHHILGAQEDVVWTLKENRSDF
jgi:GntR family carbon starvation induced transcriptional regulator